MKNKLLEELADLEHKQWSQWMKYLFETKAKITGYWSTLRVGDKPKTINISFSFEDWKRWEKQRQTDYKDLTEKEKESNREWARLVLKIIEDNQ